MLEYNIRAAIKSISWIYYTQQLIIYLLNVVKYHRNIHKYRLERHTAHKE